MSGTPKPDRATRRRRGSTPVSYRAECFDCDWGDWDASGTESARYHALTRDHTAAVSVERDYIYRGKQG